jgi:hypothetical protein
VSLGEQARQRRMTEAMALLGRDDVRAVDYRVVGTGGLPPRRLLLVVGGVALAIVAVIAVAAQVLITGGALPVVAVCVIYQVLNRPRGLLVTDRGMALLQLSPFSGRPKPMLDGLVDTDGLDQPVETSSVYGRIRVGEHTAWVKIEDLQRLQLATRRTR